MDSEGIRGCIVPFGKEGNITATGEARVAHALLSTTRQTRWPVIAYPMRVLAKEWNMAEPIHPAAQEHLPSFITAPGQPDVLMIVMGFFLVLAVMGFGILFFRLHSLPERMAHKSHKIQFEIVAVLCLGRELINAQPEAD
jgi:hypothetical protein